MPLCLTMDALMPSLRTLVVEDDVAIRRGVVDALRAAGHQPFEAVRADDARRLAIERDFDLVLLDLVLPGGSGWDILQTVRAARPTLPIIVLTACGSEDDRVDGLRLGADDYVVKPFSLRELLARVDAVARRTKLATTAPTQVAFVGGTVETQSGRVDFDDGSSATLSEKEAGVLAFLAQRAGQVVSRNQLIAGVWGLNPKGLTTRTVDMHITRLREKLRDNAADPQIVQTAWGRGYLFRPRSSD